MTNIYTIPPVHQGQKQPMTMLYLHRRMGSPTLPNIVMPGDNPGYKTGGGPGND